MYASTDPRAALTPRSAAKAPPASGFGEPAYGRYYDSPPQTSDERHKAWLTRGQNFLAMYIEAEAGYTFSRMDQPDEYVLLLPDDGARAKVAWQQTETEIKGPSVTFVPAGASSLVVESKCRIAGFFTSRSKDLVSLCANARDFVEDPNVGELVSWPDPTDGFKVRSHDLAFPIAEGKFGRLFRCTTFMVNFFDPRNGRRDPKTLSPHDHDDFQQCSLILEGTYVHHMRWPWVVDRTKWREDVHETIGAPSVTFIPARVMHTSEASGPGLNLLIDIFCPPRSDFSAKPGWVLNAAEYPQPPKQGDDV